MADIASLSGASRRPARLPSAPVAWGAAGIGVVLVAALLGLVAELPALSQNAAADEDWRGNSARIVPLPAR